MPRPAVIVESDASWADGCARLCWLVFHPATAPWGCVSEIPGTFLSRRVPRDTQISIAELLAAILPLWLSPSLFLDAAVSIFMDNVAALCALVNGGFKAWDLSHMSLAFHALLCRLRAVCGTWRVSPTLLTVGRVLAWRTLWLVSFAYLCVRCRFRLGWHLCSIAARSRFCGSSKIALHGVGFDGSCVADHGGSNGSSEVPPPAMRSSPEFEVLPPVPLWPGPGGSLAIVARPWAGSASDPHPSQPIANRRRAGVHYSSHRCNGSVKGTPRSRESPSDCEPCE